MEYAIVIVDENGDDVGTPIGLEDYLASNKNPSQLLDEINSRIDEFENDDDEDAEVIEDDD